VDKKEIFITAIKSKEGLIYKIAAIYTNTIEDRNDLVQEIIYQLWKSFDSFNQKSGLSTWMYRVVMNVAIYHLKIARRKISTVAMDSQFLNFHEADNSEMEEKWLAFRQHINNLNLLDKGIVMLYLENKSYEEIAEITGISISNVGTKLSRIKEKLKKQIFKQL
jgi:RNA polymerase sigma factor (sigma-70 family)